MTLLGSRDQIVPHQIFGALPGQSAVDRVSCAIHDAKAIMRNRKVMAMTPLGLQEHSMQ